MSKSGHVGVLKPNGEKLPAGKIERRNLPNSSRSTPQCKAFSAKNSTCMRNLCVKITHLDETSWLASGGHIAISCVVACSIYDFLSHMR